LVFCPAGCLESNRALLGDVSGGPDKQVAVRFCGMGSGRAHLDLVKRGKGARRMPRRGQAMKDVASCDKSGGAARRR
jgi:hypothetical protein